ncbi:MAG TPA: hypothetical protein VIO38_02980 [Rariglobus sp.]
MIIALIVTLVAIYLAGFVLMARAVKCSPDGYEDERGFSKEPRVQSERFSHACNAE